MVLLSSHHNSEGISLILRGLGGAGGFGKRANFAAELFNQRNCRRQFFRSTAFTKAPRLKLLAE